MGFILGDKSWYCRWCFLTLKPGIPGGPGGPGGHRAGHCREQKHFGLTGTQHIQRGWLHPLGEKVMWVLALNSLNLNAITASWIDQHLPVEQGPRGPGNPQNNDLWMACSTLNTDCETFWWLTVSTVQNAEEPKFPSEVGSVSLNL